jgi:nucleoside-diphosphate-sugar epimerase
MESIILISGVAGMTGSMTAEKLLERGETVIGFDNFFAGSRDVVTKLLSFEKFHFFESDINNANDMSVLFSLLESEYPINRCQLSFINCAAVVHTKHFYQPHDTFLTNVVAMYDSLNRAIKGSFQTFINCSTSEVYSMRSWQEGGVREDSPVLIATAEQSLRASYAVGKLLTEYFLLEVVEKRQIRGCSIRFANVYSASEEHEEHIIPHIIASLFREKRVVLLENAKKTYRTFLHNRDSCAAVVSFLDNPTALNGEVYNVGTSEEISIPDLVSKIANLMDLTNVKIEYKGRRSADPPRRLLNIDKIYKATGWVPTTSLDEGLHECVLSFCKG